MTLADKIITFNKSLHIAAQLPEDVTVLNPFHEAAAASYTKAFYEKFYSSSAQRTLIMGINPGRFGGGVTGIPFTDPIKLEQYCGIENTLAKKQELSADFIYQMISAYGGPKIFYDTFYISAVSPLGFTSGGKNLNYYDHKQLQVAVEPFILDCLKRQLRFGLNTEVCFCLGEGANAKYLVKLNAKYNFFKRVVALPHPRFIMQYKRKLVTDYVDRYVQALNAPSLRASRSNPLL